MANGISGEIIGRHCCGKGEGAYLPVAVDFVLVHDPALALLLSDLKDLGRGIWDKDKVLVTVDHFAPPSTIERADMVRDVLAFAEDADLPHCRVYEGICHQLLVEGPWVGPGMLVIGADSHTTTAGALGCVATGVASTDMLYTLVTGRTWLRPPEAVRVDLRGRLPEHVMGKDVVLELLGRFGQGGCLYQALEFRDWGEAVAMDDRFAICNMVVEAGATNGLFVPDGITRAYLEARDGSSDPSQWAVQTPSTYQRDLMMDLSLLSPKLALPHSPARVSEVWDAVGEKVHQVFIGSCTGGRLGDLASAAGILAGKKVHPRVRLLVAPASQEIYKRAMAGGYVQAIAEAGGVILNPSCGPCGGIDKGILGRDETCLSTANRNYRGRLGAPSSRVFLASPLTAAATAVKGEISDPREFL